MGRNAEPKDKNLYYRAREAKGLSREQAAELLDISPTTLGRIERGEICPKADNIVAMVEAYCEPQLYSYFCSNDCMIGMDCKMDEVKEVGLAEATLGILSTVNSFNKWKDKLVDISADGCIDVDEIDDFKAICESLNDISEMVERLKLCVERLKFSKAKH